MNWLHALLLGVLQGVTEFFPISSSAHLKLLKTYLEIPAGEEAVFFDLACHLGTLVALVIYFRKDLLNLGLKKIGLFVLALLPLVPAYFLLKPVREFLSQPYLLGACLLVTAIMLFFIPKLMKKTNQGMHWKNALWIGVVQTAALVPGVSRSATTITAGVWQGLSVKEAVRFSFMLSIPAVAGGAFLEMLKISGTSFDVSTTVIGFGASALVGLGMVRIAIPLLERGVFRPFAWYCLIVSILLTLYL